MYDAIQRGDQYTIPFKLYYSGKLIVDKEEPAATEEVVSGIKIQIENIVRRWPGELIFNSGSSQWLFPISKEETSSLPEHCRWQFGILKGPTYGSQSASDEEYHYSKVGNLDVLWSLMSNNWNDDGSSTSSMSGVDIPHNHQLNGNNEEVEP